jgi:NitT/TauT family transport system permease protein
VVVLGVWEFLSGRMLNENLLPGPTRIAETFPQLIESGRFFSSFGATLTRIGIGFGLAFLFGIILGILTQSRWIDGFFKDATTISLVSPGLIWALVGLVIWGFEPQGWIFAIFMTTFALVTVNIAEGIRALPKDLMDMSRAFGVTTARRQREIVIPFLAPFIFTALRFGFSIAWKVTVLTEVFSSNKGIGFEMRVASQLFRMDEFFTWVLSFFVFALFLEKVVLQRYENKFFRWRQEVMS